MTSRPFRRASFISPFGPGALSTAPDGTSTITAGLDYWFSPPRDSAPEDYDLSEFEFHEWRLQRELGVSHFRLPPDYRTNRGGFRDGERVQKNLHLSVPMLRFPRWHRCPNVKCQSLYQAGFSEIATPRCEVCKPEGQARGRAMLQVQFVAICEAGHIQDFPWREWVHQTATPACDGRLHMHTSSGGTLKAIRVICECGKSRDLEGILMGSSGATEEDPPEDQPRMTFLSKRLDPDGEHYLCAGVRPWLGDATGEGCGKPLQATLRGATNVYFATVESSIYLPLESEATAKNLLERIERAGIADDIRIFIESVPNVTQAMLKNFIGRKLPQTPGSELDDESMSDVLAHLSGESRVSPTGQVSDDSAATAYRRPEHAILRNEFTSDDLLVRSVQRDRYTSGFRNLVSRVQLVPKLRETRAFAGFSRVNPVDPDAEQRTNQLWRTPVPKVASWLPGYKVFGEGIYLELDEAALSKWEHSPEVEDRIKPLALRELSDPPGAAIDPATMRITPRFVLLHTLAHLLINQLVFDCGYSSASLRERLYVSTDRKAPMAGLLIYTASGDSEGTMGGLVRMGKPGLLETVFSSAISRAQWCSSDPVCMELGRTGQGPGSCNLAACHSCALLPETSCEEFNKFLDRWTVVGEPKNQSIGFFAPLVNVLAGG